MYRGRGGVARLRHDLAMGRLVRVDRRNVAGSWPGMVASRQARHARPALDAGDSGRGSRGPVHRIPGRYLAGSYGNARHVARGPNSRRRRARRRRRAVSGSFQAMLLRGTVDRPFRWIAVCSAAWALTLPTLLIVGAAAQQLTALTLWQAALAVMGLFIAVAWWREQSKVWDYPGCSARQDAKARAFIVSTSVRASRAGRQASPAWKDSRPSPLRDTQPDPRRTRWPSSR